MIWTLVPAKSFAQAKSRLSPLLTPEQRIRLSVALLTRTVRIVGEAFGPARLQVVSADSDVLALAGSLGVAGFSASTAGLNAQLAEAAAGISPDARVLVLHADLPTLQVDDLHALAAIPEAIAVCPDRHDVGTNALLQQPSGRGQFQFGPGSFERHCQAAGSEGNQAAVLRRRGLALDLDTPADWHECWPAPDPSFDTVLAGLSS